MSPYNSTPGNGTHPIDGFAMVLSFLLLALGLGYRFWRWVQTPDEVTARKRASRREQLRQVVRRPAKDIPIMPVDTETTLDDPSLNGLEPR